MYDLTISIITNNSEKLIKKCIASIESAISKYSYNTIVLDNYSNDDTVSIIKENFPQTELIESLEKRGFGSNQNSIIKDNIDKSKYILILNDDVVLSPGCLDCMIDFLEENTSIGGVCPQIFYPDGTLQVSGGFASGIERELIRKIGISKIIPSAIKYKLAQIPSFFRPIFGKAINSYLDNLTAPTDRVRLVDYLSGACLLCRSKIFTQTGFFDERFFMYYEDVDFGIRVREAGWMLAVLTTQDVIHHTKSSWGYVSQVELERSMFNYYAKYKASLFSMITLSLITMIHSLIVITINYVILLFDRDNLDQRKSNIDANKSIINMALECLIKVFRHNNNSGETVLIEKLVR